MVRYGMVIDLLKCINCGACTVACKAENTTPSGVSWQVVLNREYGQYPNTTRSYLPRPCMHCEEPACVTVCPTGASYTRPDGIVIIDPDKCIGCKYCIAACPYGVRVYVRKIEPYFSEAGLTPVERLGYSRYQAGVVQKCTFCAHRIDAAVEQGLKPGVDRDATPACVITCHPGARIFGDLDDPNSAASKARKSANAQQLLPELNTNPSVYYISPTKFASRMELPQVEVS